jgi:signal transduction histidine kinase/CheY-like chemotaxis protein
VSLPILSAAIRYEPDVVAVRQRARQIAGLLGFDTQEQTRIATAVSEIARNAFRYAGGGKVDFVVQGRTSPQLLVIAVTDEGPGIPDVPQILAGQYRSETGMGLGIVGARRLMDQFEIQSAPGRGTEVLLKKLLPRRGPLVTAARVAEIGELLTRQNPQSPVEEIQHQNRELLRTLAELRARQEDLERLNHELEDTNRGVLALYAELDEKADHLRRADEMKTRFLSNMSHEFRTPLNSIRALSRLLADRVDGELTGEQERQVGFIVKAADDLAELVNDLLDLAKVEAGKTVVRPVEFDAGNLFGALRGMLRPLLLNESVALVFEEPTDLPVLVTDEAKVSQILRNFVSNALKFTERGEVRVSARFLEDTDAVVFTVSDTGIGIAPEDQERIFEEFSQLESPMQRTVHGTGLGLPLTRRLAALLGGRIAVTSTVGVGSSFSATIPRVYRETTVEEPLAERVAELDATLVPVLVVEDSPQDAMLYEKFLRGSRYQPVVVRSIKAAREALQRVRPRAILLDILLGGEDSWSFLAELKQQEATRCLPVVVATTVDDRQKGFSLGADAYAVKPVERAWLLQTLDRLIRTPAGRTVLVIDDDDASRYLLRTALVRARCTVLEASTGAEGVRMASETRPDAIFLDLVMPGISGFEVLDQLKSAALTRDIPVVVVTSRRLTDDERHDLAGAVTVLPKDAQTVDDVIGRLGLAG